MASAAPIRTLALHINQRDGAVCAYAGPPDWCWRPA